MLLIVLVALALVKAEIEVEVNSDGQILVDLQHGPAEKNMVRRQESKAVLLEGKLIQTDQESGGKNSTAAAAEALRAAEALKAELDADIQHAIKAVEIHKASNAQTIVLKDQSSMALEAINRGLVAATSTVLILFYLMSCGMKVVEVCCAKVLHQTCAVFFPLLGLMVCKKLWKLMCPDPMTTEQSNAADVLIWVRFIGILLVLPVMLFCSKCPRRHAMLRASGTFLIGLTGTDCVVNVLQAHAWSQSSGFYFLGVMIWWMSLEVILVLTFLIRKGLFSRIFKKGEAEEASLIEAEEASEAPDGQPDSSKFEKWDMEVADMEDEGVSLIVSFAISMAIRYEILQALPGTHHRAVTNDDAHKLAACAMGAIGIFILVNSVLMKLVPKLAALKNSAHRPLQTLGWVTGFGTIWLVYYSLQWGFWVKAEESHKESNVGQQPYFASFVGLEAAGEQCGCATVLVAAVLLALAGARMKDGMETAATKLLGLLLGYSWEFYTYETIVASSMKDDDNTTRQWSSIFLILQVMIITLPAWIIFILPAACSLEDAKPAVEEADKDAKPGDDDKAPADKSELKEAAKADDASAPETEATGGPGPRGSILPDDVIKELADDLNEQADQDSEEPKPGA